MIKNKKITENKTHIFYKNIFTCDYEDGYKIVLAKNKETKKSEYLLVYKGTPIYANLKIENIYYHKNVLDFIKNKNEQTKKKKN